jgi:hypothetical protein
MVNQLSSTHLRDRIVTAASHYVLDFLQPLSPLWNIGMEVVKEGEDLPNFDENDLITILIDQLEDALLDKWRGDKPYNPSTYTALCVLLSDVEWDIILVNLIPEWNHYIQREQEKIAQEHTLITDLSHLSVKTDIFKTLLIKFLKCDNLKKIGIAPCLRR